MMKPVSSRCNMRCRYCFYADVAANRAQADYGRMTPETLRAVLEKVLAEASCQCSIAFQGGEPTLAGLPFFRETVDLCQRLNKNRCRISFSLQTNGLLIDEEWCEFLAENRFLVGVSLDGPKEFHDENRLDTCGKGTYSRVFRALQLLRGHGVETNILAVVTARTARHYGKVHGFFSRSGFLRQQYIPCLDPLDRPRGRDPWSLTPERMGEYLKTAFDRWYQDILTGGAPQHRYFDNLLRMMAGQLPEACGMMGVCARQYVVEADGSVYPCDFYVLDKYRLGNLNADTLADIEARRREADFVRQSRRLPEECGACRWYGLCRNGCWRDREQGRDGAAKNYYCPAYQEFFAYAWPKLEFVSRRMLDQNC